MSRRIKKDDMVLVVSGDDKGKRGRVLKVYPDTNRIIVEGVNNVRKAIRRTQDNPRGGHIDKEAPVNMSNVMLVCGKCNKTTRIAVKTMEDGNRMRYCKKCDAELGG